MKTKVQILVSTMNNQPELLERLNVTTDAVVVNQCGRDARKEFEFRGHQVTWIDSSSRGLSVSRNIAVENASADYIVLVDDDEVLNDGLEEQVAGAFRAHEEMDVIAWQIEGIERKFKDYAPDAHEITKMGSMKLSSAELTMKRSSITDNGIRFHEKFGSGAKYKMGEENIFLFSCYGKGLRAFYIPERLARLHMEESTWFEGYNEKYFIDRGATYYEMFGWLSVPMVIQFLLRKKALYRETISAAKAFRMAMQGIRERKKDRR